MKAPVVVPNPQASPQAESSPQKKPIAKLSEPVASIPLVEPENAKTPVVPLVEKAPVALLNQEPDVVVPATEPTPIVVKETPEEQVTKPLESLAHQVTKNSSAPAASVVKALEIIVEQVKEIQKEIGSNDNNPQKQFVNGHEKQTQFRLNSQQQVVNRKNN